MNNLQKLKEELGEEVIFGERNSYINLTLMKGDIGYDAGCLHGENRFNFRFIRGSRVHRAFKAKGYKFKVSPDNNNNVILWFDLEYAIEFRKVVHFVKQMHKFTGLGLIERPERAIY
ncbi:hypothetical protein [Bacillus sp. 165]|uniref:hypothetical protein n=1 Tax=Bacillus sp. 165 TaxID=1529117 RepID=UPI001AD95626|nr:hypothetical protein [Bacillus sp. 165]MBO9129516.1 hypothetical protein [Bacillus sp. 165]